MTLLLTWRDVVRVARRAPNKPWKRIVGGPDEVQFVIDQTCLTEAKEVLGELFKERFQSAKEESKFRLEPKDGEERFLDCMWVSPDESGNPPVPRPFWSNLIMTDLMEQSAPTPFEGDRPRVIAFYSYKGGVGRTTALLGVLASLLGRKKPTKVLVVDADIEAPGLTWNIGTKRLWPSLVDVLGLVQDEVGEWREQVVPLVAKLMRQNLVSVEVERAKGDFYFLPAFRDPQQLFEPLVTFEHVAMARGRQNDVAEIVHALGQAVEADVVLVDLRAGLSEAISPLMLDPRVAKVLVTSCSEQSMEGMALVLDQAKTRLGAEENRPLVLVNMMPLTLSEQKRQSALQTMADKLPGPSEEDAFNVLSASHAEELVHFDDLSGLMRDILPGTSLGKRCREIADSLLPEPNLDHIPFTSSTQQASSLEAMAKKYEYAENIEELSLLPFHPLKKLLSTFDAGTRSAVVIGSKGSGKTFAWAQMALAGTIEKFSEAVRGKQTGTASADSMTVFPLLRPSNLGASLTSKTDDLENTVHRALGVQDSATANTLRNALETSSFGSGAEDFWWDWIAKRLGFNGTGPQTAQSIVQKLEARGVRILLTVDGIEDALQPKGGVLTKEQEEVLRALLQTATNAIRDLRSPHLGIVTFIRRDLAQAAIHQNWGQFYHAHEDYALIWDPTEALRLVAWVLEKTGECYLASQELHRVGYEGLRDALKSFWGERLGSPKSREAQTDRWVIASMSDFQGRLQARDIVRFLRYAGTTSDRPVPPRILREALQKSANEKINELEQEIVGLKTVFEKLKNAEPEDMRIPLMTDKLKLSEVDIKLLEDAGALGKYQDSYYMPEIIRKGLGYTMAEGRRPPVLKLYDSATSKRS